MNEKELLTQQLIELKKMSEDMREIRSKLIPNAPNIEEAISSGKDGITRYFDRIHDSLSTYNNVLIVGYFTLIQLGKEIPVVTILIPVCNLIVFIVINYLMMEYNRTNSNLGEMTIEQIRKVTERLHKATQYSWITIISTLIVTVIFLYYLFR